uniref:WRKY domain-containing protein n=1 Tax=Leersia perrieri TaxID=77586 RepID=A0A0D9W1K2_9ORYZ
MDMMEQEANAGTAQAAAGDLADVVARASSSSNANARPLLHHHHHHHHHHHSPLPLPLPLPLPPMPPHHQYYQEQIWHPTTTIACSDAAPVPGVSSSLDSYLSPPASSFGMPQQQLAVQISQHAAAGDVLMGGACPAADDAEDAINRISPLTPSAHHQMMKRKNEVKKVVCIPAPPATSGRGGGGEVIPSDLWAWRKYGQKPIKGSPYPRGYYRCSSSKGCMARKQVERSRSDPNMLVITYTAEHNHPWPMQRNVLAGYARSHHTNATASTSNNRHKQQQQQPPAALISATCSSSSSSSSSSCNAVHADMLGGQPANMMMITEAGAGLGNSADFQPAADEVFAELEELEPDNPTMIDPNMVYSMASNSRPAGSYEWHRF